MAFIQIRKSADNPNEGLLVNTDQILTVRLGPAGSNSSGYTHYVAVNILKADQVLAYFKSLTAAQAAYNQLTAYLMTEAVTIALY